MLLKDHPESLISLLSNQMCKMDLILLNLNNLAEYMDSSQFTRVFSDSVLRVESICSLAMTPWGQLLKLEFRVQWIGDIILLTLRQ